MAKWIRIKEKNFNFDTIMGMEVKEKCSSRAWIFPDRTHYVQLWMGNAGDQVEITKEEAEIINKFLTDYMENHLEVDLVIK